MEPQAPENPKQCTDTAAKTNSNKQATINLSKNSPTNTVTTAKETKSSAKNDESWTVCFMPTFNIITVFIY